MTGVNNWMVSNMDNRTNRDFSFMTEPERVSFLLSLINQLEDYETDVQYDAYGYFENISTVELTCIIEGLRMLGKISNRVANTIECEFRGVGYRKTTNQGHKD